MGITYRTSTLFQATKGIVQDGLVLNLDAGVDKSYPRNGTTWNDLAGSNSGTLINGPTFDRDNGGSINFDGTNDYVDCGGNLSPLFITGAHTVVSWFNSDTTAGETTICRFKGVSNYLSTIKIYSSTIGYGMEISGVNYGTRGSFSSTDTWNNVVGTYDGNTTVRVFVNGSEISGSTARPPGGGGLSDVIGATNNGAYFFNGLIGTVQIYNRELSSDEILQNYNATKRRFE